MKELRSLNAWHTLKSEIPSPLGLVPTMGALHEGHLSLIRRSVAENKHTLVWIFVNPLQFNRSADLAAYPRQMKKDIALAQENGADSLLAPAVKEIYPPKSQTIVELPKLSSLLEGQHRQGHFKGVTTVITKLLCLTLPQKIYFGQKDAQQCVIIKRLVGDLLLDCQVVICPTIRNPDGLALSSRNALLTKTARLQAPCLYQALQIGADAIAQKISTASEIKRQMLRVIKKAPLAQLEYLSLADPEDLAEQIQISPPTLISLAARFGKVRLIDNILV